MNDNMNDNVIVSDHPLDPARLRLLASLADTIVPASADGRMPTAGDMDLVGHIQQFSPEFLTELPQILDCFDTDFPEQDLDDRCERVKVFSEAEPALFRHLLSRVYACYYQDDQVRRAIGAGVGAPFPRGNEVAPGDLSLLDPVMNNPITWRR